MNNTQKNLRKFNRNIELDIGSIKANFVYDCPYLDLVINNDNSKSYYCDENLQFNQSYCISNNFVDILLPLNYKSDYYYEWRSIDFSMREKLY